LTRVGARGQKLAGPRQLLAGFPPQERGLQGEAMLRAAEVIIAENVHGFYCVPKATAQLPSAQTVIKGQVWEPDTVDCIVRHCAGRSVVHAGAFFGDFLPAVSKALVSPAVLYVAEPNPENYAATEWTVRINRLRNVKLFAGALGRAAATVDIIVKSEQGESLGGWSRVREQTMQIAPERLVQAQVQSIDHLCGESEIGVIHLDVEGYETEALAGASEVIRRCRPMIIVETKPSDAWLQANLTSLGYVTAATSLHGNTVFSVA
jgi:FkbM family methyltransferase